MGGIAVAGLMTLGLVSTGSAELLHGAHRVVDTLEGLDVEQLQAWFGYGGTKARRHEVAEAETA